MRAMNFDIMWRRLLAGVLMGLALGAAADDAPDALPKEVVVNGVEFVLIPEGWFYKTGGIPEEGGQYEFMDERGGGNVRIWLDAYYIAKYEARARDLVAFLNSGKAGNLEYAGANISCSTRRDARGRFYQVNPEEDHPATHLHWDLADRWARWMGFRLLTEFEWEKAARGPDQRTYPWGDDFPDETYAGYKTRSDCHTWSVDSFRKGVSPYGVYNMSGNVREFVADWYSADFDQRLKEGDRNPVVPAAARSTRKYDPTGPRWEGGPWKLIKGGRWASHEHQLRIGARIYYLPEEPFRCNGTRFAIDVRQVREHLAKGTAVAAK